jgi:hypothetical protein
VRRKAEAIDEGIDAILDPCPADSPKGLLDYRQRAVQRPIRAPKGSRIAAGHRPTSDAATARQSDVSGNNATYPIMMPNRPNGVPNTV